MELEIQFMKPRQIKHIVKTNRLSLIFTCYLKCSQFKIQFSQLSGCLSTQNPMTAAAYYTY